MYQNAVNPQLSCTECKQLTGAGILRFTFKRSLRAFILNYILEKQLT